MERKNKVIVYSVVIIILSITIAICSLKSDFFRSDGIENESRYNRFVFIVVLFCFTVFHSLYKWNKELFRTAKKIVMEKDCVCLFLNFDKTVKLNYESLKVIRRKKVTIDNYSVRDIFLISEENKKKQYLAFVDEMSIEQISKIEKYIYDGDEKTND